MFPLLIPMLFGSTLGPLTSKGARAFRESWNEGEKIGIDCRRCLSSGPHVFVRIDRKESGGLLSGILLGVPGGALHGLTGKRIFKCERCSTEMYEDGSHLGASFSERMDGFANYPKLRESVEQLQYLMKNHTKIAAKHMEEIVRLETELFALNSDKELLERKVRQLIEKIRKDAA
jgi:hypothetical protein